MIIILDNGHGVDTQGKRSPVWSDRTQLFEWAFTRDIVFRISKSLNKLSIKNSILVPESKDVSLAVRARRANNIYLADDKSVLISIHGNAGEQPNQGEGWEVWTSPGQTESDRLASLLFESAVNTLKGFKMRSDYADGDPDKESKFYILTKTACPAVLTENLFYDNEYDCKFMMSDEGRRMIANLHIDAITKYLK